MFLSEPVTVIPAIIPVHGRIGHHLPPRQIRIILISILNPGLAIALIKSISIPVFVFPFWRQIIKDESLKCYIFDFLCCFWPAGVVVSGTAIHWWLAFTCPFLDDYRVSISFHLSESLIIQWLTFLRFPPLTPAQSHRLRFSSSILGY